MTTSLRQHMPRASQPGGSRADAYVDSVPIQSRALSQCDREVILANFKNGAHETMQRINRSIQHTHQVAPTGRTNDAQQNSTGRWDMDIRVSTGS